MWSKIASNYCWLWLAISALVLSAYIDSTNGARPEESEELAPFLSWMFSHNVNTRSGNTWKGSSKLQASEFLGKRLRGSEFLGKRASEFLGKRASEFLGKREAKIQHKRLRGSEFLGKRSAMAHAHTEAESAPELPMAAQSDRDLFWSRFSHDVNAEDEDVMD